MSLITIKYVSIISSTYSVVLLPSVSKNPDSAVRRRLVQTSKIKPLLDVFEF